MFSIDDVGTVSFVQRDNARKEKEDGVASVVQSTSGDSGSVEANETNLPLMAQEALKIDEPSNPMDYSSTTVSSKQTTKKKYASPIFHQCIYLSLPQAFQRCCS